MTLHTKKNIIATFNTQFDKMFDYTKRISPPLKQYDGLIRTSRAMSHSQIFHIVRGALKIDKSFIQNIKSRNHEFFLNLDPQKYELDDMSINGINMIFSIWKEDLKETQKDVIWRYLNLFLVLINKYECM